MKLTIGHYLFDVNLETNITAKSLLKHLPLELKMSELNGNEKYHYLNFTLPSNAQRVEQIKTGDVMLYGDNCIVIFYKSFASGYSYTKIGHIEDSTNLEKALGSGSVDVVWNI